MSAIHFHAWVALAALLPAQAPPPQPQWQDALDWLDGEAKTFAADLETTHGALRARAEREDRALLAKLSPEPPRSLARGYGILPELRAGVPYQSVQLQVRRYSLERLSVDFMLNVRDAALLARRAVGDGTAPLGAMIDRLEQLQGRLRFMEAQIAYHRQWQQSVLDYLEYFAKQNELLVKAQELKALLARTAELGLVTAKRREILTVVAPFQPTQGLAIERDGTDLVLRVEMLTDVLDEAFLAAFRGAVDTEFNAAPAARDAHFRIALTITPVDPHDLYPEGVPGHGTAIDLKEHVARFPAGALVLTTGAQTTYADVGRALHFGAEPVAPRVLAHEFGHLLGFRDAYLRAYEGQPGSRFGVTLMEWTGLRDDLMGAPGRGRVTADMVGELLEAYGDG